MKKISRIFLFTGVFAVPALASESVAHRFTAKQARAIALQTAPGRVASSELEFEKGQWVYSFDIKGPDRRIHEVLVNADTGRIVEQSIGSPAAEAAEAASDSAGR